MGARCYFLMAAKFTALEAKGDEKKKGGASSCVIARVFKEWWTLVNGAAGVITVQESQIARLCAI